MFGYLGGPLSPKKQGIIISWIGGVVAESAMCTLEIEWLISMLIVVDVGGARRESSYQQLIATWMLHRGS